MDYADLGKEEHDGSGGEDICIDISFIIKNINGKPKHHGEDCSPESYSDTPFDGMKPEHDKPMKQDKPVDDDCVDWKSVAKQLLQAVSMMDTHTDGVEAGTEEPEGALKAIDNETSRILWGKQEEDNPMSSYQNANYNKTTANGLVMTNPAVQYNKDAYSSELDPDMDGDVDFHNPEVVDKVDKKQGFKEAANNVIQKGSRGSNEKKQGLKESSGSDSGFGKQKSESGSEEEESESKESEVK